MISVIGILMYIWVWPTLRIIRFLTRTCFAERALRGARGESESEEAWLRPEVGHGLGVTT